MHLVPEITYPADGTNIVTDASRYLNQRLAEDVPVTELQFRKVILDFLYNIYSGPLRGTIRVRVSPADSEDLTLIGERVLILDLLMEMIQNSKEAGASVFDLSVEHDEAELRLTVRDDGNGIDTDQLVNSVPAGYTKKSTGWGWSLYHAAMNLKKIGATVRYDSAGIDGAGVQFTITFLRQMPEG